MGEESHKGSKDFLKNMNSSEDKVRKTMIKQKEEYEEYKKNEGDSDLVFNEKDNKTKLSHKKTENHGDTGIQK